MLGSNLFACSRSHSSSAAFWNLPLTRWLFTHSLPVSNSAHKTSRLHSLYAFWPGSETSLWRRRLLHSCDFTYDVVFWDSLAIALRLTEFGHNTTTHCHANQDHKRVRIGSQETHEHEQLSCRRQGSPTAIDYRFGERARITMRPQTKCARSQITTSAQICVTL